MDKFLEMQNLPRLNQEETEKMNRIESPEIHTHKYNQLIFNKWAKAIQWSKDSLSNNGAGTTGLSHAKKMNLDTDIILFTNINLKWITDLHRKWKTIKLLEDNIGKILDNLGYGDALLDTRPKIWSIKELNEMLDPIKI